MLGVAKGPLVRFPDASTIKTSLGVTPSMRVFGFGFSRLRFVASRSRLELTSATRVDVGRTRLDPPETRSALVTSRRDLDAPKRGPKTLTQKPAC